MKIFVEARINDGIFSDSMKKEFDLKHNSFESFLCAMENESVHWRGSLTGNPFPLKGFVEIGYLGLTKSHWHQFLQHGNLAMAPKLKNFPNFIRIRMVDKDIQY